MIDHRPGTDSRTPHRFPVPGTRFPTAILLAFSLLIGCGDGSSVEDPVEAIANPQTVWEEEDFGRDPEIHADLGHVVMLDIEAQRGGFGRRENHIRYRVDEATPYSFCIPEDEPYIEGVEMVGEDGEVAFTVERGECQTQTVEPGRYTLVVIHDATNVPPDGAVAFAHVPRTKRFSEELDPVASQSGVLGATAVPPIDAPSCQGLPADAGQTRSISALQLADGRWLYSGSDSSGTVQIAPHTVIGGYPLDLATGGWSACRDVNGNYRMAGRRPGNTGAYMYHEQNSAFVPIIATIPLNDIYDIIDLGNFQFTMETTQNRSPLYIGTDNLLHWSISSPPQQPTTLTNALTYYPAGVTVPTLQPGEVALTHNCNYDTSKGTWVVRASVPDSGAISYGSPFTGERFTLPVFGGLGHPGDSMRLGPDTVIQTFRNTNYVGEITYVGASQSCVWFEDPTLSFKIFPSRQWIVSTNKCEYCNLTNADLSGIDLSFGSFYSSTLSGADVTDMIYRNANLDYANFSGGTTRLQNANFHNARLNSAAFRGNDLTQANMQSDDNLKPQKLDMNSATLKVSTMFPQHWRYNDMTGVVFTDSKGAAVSSASAPLDLTGAKFSHASMPGIVLTGANLASADFSYADLTGADLGAVIAPSSTPAKFNRAALIHAYMKNALLPGSFFRGAVMSPVNLGGADLAGAWFEDDGSGNFGAANLSGSFMLNTKLNGAHLTNSVLDGVSWYNVDPSSPIATGAGAFFIGASFNLADLPGLDLTGAFMQGATMTNVQLIGANLTGARFDRNGQTRSNLSTANLRGANLTNANLGYAILQNAGVDATAESEVFIEVLKDPDHFQKAIEYQYFAVNRPATNLGSSNASAITDNATCPSGVTGPCGTISSPAWIAPAGPIEPTDCMPTEFDSEGNVIAITCSSSRHPTG